MFLLKKKNVLFALIFFVFGTMTIMSGGRALFTDVGISTRGNIVPLVLWFNFVAGFFYLMAAISTFKLKTCVKKLITFLAVSNVLVLLYLIIHILQGGLYENRTIFSMSFRTAFWIFFAVYFHRSGILKNIKCNC